MDYVGEGKDLTSQGISTVDQCTSKVMCCQPQPQESVDLLEIWLNSSL